MGTLISIAQLITGISILVILHELGHFWAARAFGIKVEKFYLFFDAWGKRIFSVKVGETEYGIGWLPLGGYVKIAGMIDESMDSEQMAKPAEPWEFRSKPAWQRLIVMIGGVVMNVIAGIIIFAMLKYTYGDDNVINSSIKHGIYPNELAKEIGFRKGDNLVSVNGKPIYYYNDAMNSEILLGDAPPVYVVKRNGADTTIQFPKDYLKRLTKSARSGFFVARSQVFVKNMNSNSPIEKAGIKKDDQIIGVDSIQTVCFDEFLPTIRKRAGKQATLVVLRNSDTLRLPVNVSTDSTIGFYHYDKTWVVDTTFYSFAQSFPEGVSEAFSKISDQITGWGKIMKQEIPVNKAVQGPLGLLDFYGPVWDGYNFWFITAIISLGLAFMNILPIPALDGGHVVILLIEMVTGRPLSTKVMERVQMVGMVILLTLMVLVFGNDIINKWFSN